MEIELEEKHLLNARVLPNRNHILRYLPYNITFCEVGVLIGDWSNTVINTGKISHFYALDTFDRSRTHRIFEGYDETITHRNLYERRFEDQINQGLMTIIEGDSKETLKLLENNSIDVFYLDSFHSYDQVKQELEIVKYKIKDTGYIIFNDYTHYDPFYNCALGVIPAANEFIINNGYKVKFYALHKDGFNDLVISKD